MTLSLHAEWQPSLAEFEDFAALSGDTNEIHLSDAAADGGFGRPVAHGMLIYAKLWAMLRSARAATRPEVHNLMFPNPCFAGDPVRLEVTQDSPRGRILLRAARVADEAEVLVGEVELH